MTYPNDQPLLPTRSLSPGQTTQVWVVDVDNGVPELVYSSDELLLEAPNWAPDGAGLLLNGDGLLWRLDLEPAVALTPVPIEECRRSTTTMSSWTPRADLSVRQ